MSLTRHEKEGIVLDVLDSGGPGEVIENANQIFGSQFREDPSKIDDAITFIMTNAKGLEREWGLHHDASFIQAQVRARRFVSLFCR